MKHQSLVYSIFIGLWILCGSLSCERGDRLWRLDYRVTILSGKGTYTVKYLNKSGADVQEGGLTSNWASSTYTNVETGQRVRLQVLTQTAGSMQFRLEILRDGAVHEAGESAITDREYSISDVL